MGGGGGRWVRHPLLGPNPERPASRPVKLVTWLVVSVPQSVNLDAYRGHGPACREYYTGQEALAAYQEACKGVGTEWGPLAVALVRLRLDASEPDGQPFQVIQQVGRWPDDPDPAKDA